MEIRTIKFRGKKLCQDEWIYGSLITRGERGADGNFIDTGRGECYPLQQDTIGQYTGLHDKNGQEIYEGDILRGDYYPYHNDGEDNYLGVVFFADDNYTWEVMKFVTAQSKLSGISNFVNDEFYETDFSQMEVIGNVWDSNGLFRDSDEKIMKWFNG